MLVVTEELLNLIYEFNAITHNRIEYDLVNTDEGYSVEGAVTMFPPEEHHGYYIYNIHDNEGPVCRLWESLPIMKEKLLSVGYSEDLANALLANIAGGGFYKIISIVVNRSNTDPEEIYNSISDMLPNVLVKLRGVIPAIPIFLLTEGTLIYSINRVIQKHHNNNNAEEVHYQPYNHLQPSYLIRKTKRLTAKKKKVNVFNNGDSIECVKLGRLNKEKYNWCSKADIKIGNKYFVNKYINGIITLEGMPDYPFSANHFKKI
jgi:hypothetical protein